MTSPIEETNEEQQEPDNMYTIRLPTIHLQDRDEDEEEQDKDEILQEIFRMITVANVVCLTGSIVECLIVFYTIPSWQYLKQHYQDWMPHTILPFYTLWWLFMILVLKNKTEHLRQYLNWTQASAVVMATTNFLIPIRSSVFQQFHILFVALSILASFMFAFAKRILYANELKSERLKTRLARESTKLQQHVDQQTTNFTRHRLAFLSTVSQEIQDVALMVITTLEQFSPASILSNNHELLSACSLAVPIASISAINTTIRQVCHVSSHLQLLSKLTVQAWTGASINILQLPDLCLNEFDIGELLQNVGDALAGVASKLNVKFVIYHCDNTLHHTLVLGDEGAIRHALLNVKHHLYFYFIY
jgi:osomolarity two-component system response regulator SSK1